jgi:adenylyltransferase/sulfurtransferase
MTINRISPSDLVLLLQKKSEFLLVDLRENYELEIDGKIDYSIHIPLGEIVDRLNELPSDRPVIFHCDSGKRSESILNFLILNDLYKENYLSLDGGYQAISI